MGQDIISASDYQKLIKKGILKTDKKGRTKSQNLIVDLVNYLKKEELQQNILFKTEYDYKQDKTFYPITIKLPGEPIPKQSTRFTVNRYRTDGYHSDPWTGEQMKHSVGDVIVFLNKNNNKIDVILQAYQDSALETAKKGYQACIQAQLPSEFKMYKKEVHIISIDFIFPILKSFSQKIVKAIEDGAIVYKTTKPDMPDNLKKLPLDAMSGIVFEDDGLICYEGPVRKYYGTNPGTIIKLKGY